MHLSIKRRLLDLDLLLGLLRDSGEFIDERLAPPSTGVLVDVFGELVVVDASLLVSHGDGVVDGIGQFFRVPGVDDYAAVETLGCTSEFGQDHGTVTLLLSGNIFVRDEVHAVAGRRDKADITDSVECDQLVEGDRLVHEVDWHELDGSCYMSAGCQCLHVRSTYRICR